jgi:phosphate/sulfate permease
MKKSILSMDFSLVTLWGILLMSSFFVNTDLLFGWPIKVHIIVTGAIIGLRILLKQNNLLKLNR